jgi:hypothetical protein
MDEYGINRAVLMAKDVAVTRAVVQVSLRRSRAYDLSISLAINGNPHFAYRHAQY